MFLLFKLQLNKILIIGPGLAGPLAAKKRIKSEKLQHQGEPSSAARRKSQKREREKDRERRKEKEENSLAFFSQFLLFQIFFSVPNGFEATANLTACNCEGQGGIKWRS